MTTCAQHIALLAGESGECEGPVAILVVAPSEHDTQALGRILDDANWTLHHSVSHADALKVLRKRRIAAVVCEAQLPDASWRELLPAVAALPSPPPVLVSSALADDALWAEVVNLGGSDVLGKPFDREEVIRGISLAWLTWKIKEHRKNRARWVSA